MKEVEIKMCPFCGGEEFIDGKLISYGGVSVNTAFMHNDSLYSTVCRDCGSVVRLFVKNPEKLYPKKDRRS